MRAMRAEGFRGYQDLKLADIPKPRVSEGRVLVKIAAAGVTPLDHTILSGGYPRAKAPLVLGSEGAAVVEDANGSEFSVGARVMFTGPYGVSGDGAYSEYLAVRRENLSLIPGSIEHVSAAGIPVAYLTAHMALTLSGFQAGKTVLSPAIGGSVGNAVTQLARALGARHAMSTTTSHAKAEQARILGFDEVIDLSTEKLGEGVRRITGGYGSDLVIDAMGGDILSEALGTLAMSGSLTTLGYSAGRKSTIDVTDLIWKRAGIKSLSLFAQPPAMWSTAWASIFALLESGAIRPIVVKNTFALRQSFARIVPVDSCHPSEQSSARRCWPQRPEAPWHRRRPSKIARRWRPIRSMRCR
ncbi:MAG TPA: zinc-binding alcohol dehydrogenase family protein [Candidatus Acidoferrales bacterium]|nr:zinc-binding alcohol dehydrogenase family protein [Candidatus Acidoferrales bacterium]